VLSISNIDELSGVVVPIPTWEKTILVVKTNNIIDKYFNIALICLTCVKIIVSYLDKKEK